MSMEIIELESDKQIDEIILLQKRVYSNLPKSEWLEPVDKDFLLKCIKEDAYIFGLMIENRLVGVFILYSPKNFLEHLANELNIKQDRFFQYVHLELYMLDPKYQGKGLGSFLINKCIELALEKRWKYLVCTVHPNNKASLESLRKSGFELRKTKTMYGDKLRHIMSKELS